MRRSARVSSVRGVVSNGDAYSVVLDSLVGESASHGRKRTVVIFFGSRARVSCPEARDCEFLPS